MRCKFCFATFQDVKNSILPKGHLPEEEAVKVVHALVDYGFEKITFAGGEPTLCPWLPRLIQVAKMRGLTTMIVTNGTNLSNKFLAHNVNQLDWIALSVDSLNDRTNVDSGRALIGKRAIKKDAYIEIANSIKQYGYGLKINSVIHSKNHDEDFGVFMKIVQPKRWKVLQVLPIIGQNDGNVDDFKISNEQFELFKMRHSKIDDVTKIVYENNMEMQGSYAMVDPAGRFYDNVEGKYNYSEKITDVGVFSAITQVNYSTEKFINRGGLYDWKRTKK
jgi:radical S-adenosyl methionine domain-containing protein 2